MGTRVKTGTKIDLESYEYLPEQSFYVEGNEVKAVTSLDPENYGKWERVEYLSIRGCCEAPESSMGGIHVNDLTLQDWKKAFGSAYLMFVTGGSCGFPSSTTFGIDPRPIKSIDEHFENPFGEEEEVSPKEKICANRRELARMGKFI